MAAKRKANFTKTEKFRLCDEYEMNHKVPSFQPQQSAETILSHRSIELPKLSLGNAW
jgi:hypothetical protein